MIEGAITPLNGTDLYPARHRFVAGRGSVTAEVTSDSAVNFCPGFNTRLSATAINFYYIRA